ncbi:MAG: lysophospholipid acyltransferase family protein [Candidatus Rifleibacteriota bacterium]
MQEKFCYNTNDLNNYNVLQASKRLHDGRWGDPAYQARLRIKARLGAGFITAVNSLVKIKKIGFENYLEALKDRRPTLIVAWHNSLISSIYCHRKKNIVIMTSLSQDGDLLTQILYYLGYGCVRGSSSRGGMRGLLEMVKLLKQGENGAITVDGPRGPRHEVKPGAVLVAQKTDALIFPIGLAYSDCKRLDNWDKTEVPKPFSNVTMYTGKPFSISAKMDIKEGCELIGSAIKNCEQHAEQIIKK